MGFLEENTTTPRNRRASYVPSDALKDASKYYNTNAVANRIQETYKGIKGAPVPNLTHIASTYYPDAVLTVTPESTLTKHPPMYWHEDTVKEIVKAYPKPLPKKGNPKRPNIFVAPTPLIHTFLDYPRNNTRRNYKAGFQEALALQPHDAKVDRRGNLSVMYDVETVKKNVATIESVYSFNKNWEDSLKKTNQLIDQMNESFGVKN